MGYSETTFWRLPFQQRCLNDSLLQFCNSCCIDTRQGTSEKFKAPFTNAAYASLASFPEVLAQILTYHYWKVSPNSGSQTLIFSPFVHHPASISPVDIDCLRQQFSFSKLPSRYGRSVPLSWYWADDTLTIAEPDTQSF